MTSYLQTAHRWLFLALFAWDPPGAVLLLVFLLEMRYGARSTLRKGKGHPPTHWFVLSSSHLPEIHSLIIATTYLFPHPGFPVRRPTEIDLALWRGEWLPRAPLAKQEHSERSDVKLRSKGKLGPECRVGPELQDSENFALFLPLVERVLIFLIDSRCIWYGCLAPKLVCLTTAEDPEIHNHPSNLTGLPPTAAVLFMKWVTFLANPTTNWCWIWHTHPTSFFSFSLFTCLSSSWEAALLCKGGSEKHKVELFPSNKIVTFGFLGLVRQPCVFSFLSRGKWGRKKWVSASGGRHTCTWGKGSH